MVPLELIKIQVILYIICMAHDCIDWKFRQQQYNVTNITVACDCIDFKCTVIQVTHNHDNSVVC